MILLLNTSEPVTKLSLLDEGWRIDDEWNSERNLAKGLLGYLDRKIQEHGKQWSDISAIGVFEGPGSFTGLRIGLTVLNTLADSNRIPIVGGGGDDWQSEVLQKISDGMDEKIVLPIYGADANITNPKK